MKTHLLLSGIFVLITGGNIKLNAQTAEEKAAQSSASITTPIPNAYQTDNCVKIPNAYAGDNAIRIPNVYKSENQPRISFLNEITLNKVREVPVLPKNQIKPRK